jgi:VWFA-related protein
MTTLFRLSLASALISGTSFAICQNAAPVQAAPAAVTAPSAVVTPSAGTALQTPAQSTPQQATPPPGTPPVATPDGTQQAGQDPVFKLAVRANLVNLVFTVVDGKGRFIKNLHKENFGLLDNQRPPAAVLGFTQQTNLPLRIGIMLDTSSSIRTRFKFEQDSAYDFFRQVLQPKDRAFIEGFDIEVALTQDYTNNPALLDEGIRKLRPGGGTALFDSLYKTCRDQMLSLSEESSVRKVVILVSDGDDNYSRALESDAIKMCQRAETIVYTISTDTSPTKGKGGEVLRTIADATGGQAFYPNRLEDVANSFVNIEEELRSQYSLEYRPADFRADGSFRTIYLRAMDSRYHVRTRAGYFAPKPVQ